MDCSHKILCLGVLSGGRLIASRRLTLQESLSAQLLLQIRDLLKEVHWELTDIKNVVFANGPGSFTSLRVGLATLEGLFPEWLQNTSDAPSLSACSSLLLRCLSVNPAEDVCVLMKAGRERLYAGVRNAAGEFNEACIDASDQNDWIRKFAPHAIMAGDALDPDANNDPIDPTVFELICNNNKYLRITSCDGLLLNYLLKPDVG